MNTANYNSLVQNQADALMRFIVFITKNKTLSQDIVQEAFLKIWENRKKINNKTAKNYLFTTGYNLAISHHRTNSKHPQSNITQNLKTTIPDQNKEYDNLNEIIWQELEKLPPTAKSLIILRDWEGYSYLEIAQITALSEAQVKIGIHRARETLKLKLKSIK